MPEPDQTKDAPALPEEDPDRAEKPGEDAGPEVPEPMRAETAAPSKEAPAPSAARAEPARRGGWMAPVAGGALAAALGFGLAQFDLLGLRPAYDDSALRAENDAAGQRIAALEARLETLGAELATGLAEARAGAQADLLASIGPLSDMPARIDALAARIDDLDRALAQAAAIGSDGTVSTAALSALSAAVEALKTDVAALARAPADPEGLKAAVREELAAWEAEATARLAAEAAEAEAQTARAAALSMLQQALVTGAPYAAALPALAGDDLPEIVTKHAETGLPTAESLAEAFPEAARAALEAALRAEGGGGLAEGLWSFLRIQTGARSLTPQEGDDPDAVLSRAEAAVRGGDVAGALAELAALPPEALQAMADWSALAEVHLAATAAIAALTGP